MEGEVYTCVCICNKTKEVTKSYIIFFAFNFIFITYIKKNNFETFLLLVNGVS